MIPTHEQIEVLRRPLNPREMGECECAADQCRNVRPFEGREDVAVEPARVPRGHVAIDLARRFGVGFVRHGTLVEEDVSRMRDHFARLGLAQLADLPASVG